MSVTYDLETLPITSNNHYAGSHIATTMSTFTVLSYRTAEVAIDHEIGLAYRRSQTSVSS